MEINKNMSNGFIKTHSLWNEEQWQAAERMLEQIERQGIEMVRLSWSDQYGMAGARRCPCKPRGRRCEAAPSTR